MTDLRKVGVFLREKFGPKIAWGNGKEGDRVQSRMWSVTTQMEATGGYVREK